MSQPTDDNSPDLPDETGTNADFPSLPRQEQSPDPATSDSDPLLDALRPIVQGSRKDELPQRIRRYRIRKLLGAGSFGKVFLARDDQLQRDVAIKVPAAEVLSGAGKAHAYLAEARAIASLEHPNIVPVYDVGSTYDFACFIVTKYVDGIHLADALQKGRLTRNEVLHDLVIVARALHYAHGQGIVHRDVKPENILLDAAGTPFVVDLGLALTDAMVGSGPRTLGTPAYMSPEQARGEGHRVDGRTDIYSLGVILYEALLGRRPFTGRSSQELMENIILSEPRPLRQVDDSIPRELERICLKSLEKRSADRYSTARDFADELQAFLDEQTDVDESPAERSTESTSSTLIESGATECSTRHARTQRSSAEIVRVIPRGLRNYTAEDSDGFIRLLPGPVDRTGLPDSIRFWKTQIDPQPASPGREPFQVGVIYGPSGCGKSSLVQAGLLPRLSSQVTVVFLEVTPFDTERRLLQQIRRRFPRLPDNLNLTASLQMLRLNEETRQCARILIVMDQFEQWLSRQWQLSSDEKLTALPAALRQCDGATLQAILLVRDDFWVGITEFMRSIEIGLSESSNLRCVSLFDEKHARRVLHLLGAAYDCLPESSEVLSDQQRQFLKMAVSEISRQGHTTSIRVALMAEMLKSHEWVPETLNDIGGIQGVGVRYLEQLFDHPAAPPHFRRYRKPIERMLTAMLPPVGVDIRGRRMSEPELAATCGYRSDSAEYRELIQILDRETRIITPVDVYQVQVEYSSTLGTLGSADVNAKTERGYQLTHDYLVPSIRRWLHAKQSRTRVGRARLLLRERSEAWNAHPENRRLPDALELLKISLMVPRAERSDADQKMLRRTAAYYAVRLGLVATVLMIAVFLAVRTAISTREANRASRAIALVNVLKTTPIEAVPLAIDHLAELEQESRVALLDAFEAADDPDSRLRMALALASFGDLRENELADRIDNADAATMPLILAALNRNRPRAIEEIKRQWEAADSDDHRARLLLAALSLGTPELLASSLSCDDDPTDRSSWICHFNDWPHDWPTVLQILTQSENEEIRSAILLGLSRCSEKHLPQDQRGEFIAAAVDAAQNEPSAVMHAAAITLLDRWNAALPQLPAISEPDPESNWFVTPHGHTLIQIRPPAALLRRLHGDEGIEESRIWFADREVSVRQFQEFLEDVESPERQMLRRSYDTVLPDGTTIGTQSFKWQSIECRSVDEPVQCVNVEDAILYCNWLSRREGLDPCYDITPELLKYRFDRDGSDRLKINVWKIDFTANGYRLPAEAVWEYARRGNSEVEWPFGRDLKWAEDFAVVSPRSETGLARIHCAECGSRLPNNFGLFNMIANVPEWSHEMRAGRSETLSLTSPFGGRSWQAPLDQKETDSLYSTVLRDDVGFRIVRNVDPRQPDNALPTE